MDRSRFVTYLLRLLAKELTATLPKQGDEKFFLRSSRLYINKRIRHITQRMKDVK